MDRPAATQGRRATTVVERKLEELCASLDGALSSRQRSPEADGRLLAEIKTRTDFLRSLLAAEGECHGGARPRYLAEAEALFAVLEATFDQWARRAAGAPAAEEEEGLGEPEEAANSSGSGCSCTDSCQEEAAGDAEREAEVTRQEATSDGVAKNCDAEREDVEARKDVTPDAIVKKPDAEHDAVGRREEAAPDAIAKKRDAADETTTRATVQQRWWRRGAAWCGAAGVVAVVAVGLAVELAAVAHQNVNDYVVPT